MSALTENQKVVFARRFLLARKFLGESQESIGSLKRKGFAEAVAEVSVSTVRRWEKGKFSSGYSIIEKIAAFFNIPVYLLMDENRCSDDEFTNVLRSNFTSKTPGSGKTEITNKKQSDADSSSIGVLPAHPPPTTPPVNIMVTCAEADKQWGAWISWTLDAGGYRSSVVVLGTEAMGGEYERLAQGVDLFLGLLSANALAPESTCLDFWDGIHKGTVSNREKRFLLVEISAVDGKRLPPSIRQVASIDLKDLDPQTAVGVTLVGIRQTLGQYSSPLLPSRMNGIPPDFPGASHHLHNLKLSRNRNFTGRSRELETLRKRLESGSSMALTQATYGMGGVGKTQLANEYAYRWRDSYQVVWWIRSEDESTLTTDLTDLAKALNLPFSTSQQGVDTLKLWLLERDGWLLIFDNAETPDAIRPYLAKDGRGHTIITSRYRAWRGVADSLNVSTFERKDSITYLQKRTGLEHPESANALAEVLGDLPLALAQAAAYIEESGLDFLSYLDLFHKHQGQLLKLNPPAIEGYSHTVATTWDISFRKLAEASRIAPELISILAYFSPDAIPKEIISVDPDCLPAALRQTVQDGFLLQEAWRAMHRLSLVEAGPNTVSIHRLVQEVIIQSHSHDQQIEYVNTVLSLAVAAIVYEENNKETWNRSLPYLPHAVAAANRAVRVGCQVDKAVNLLDNVASIHGNLGQIFEAEEIYRMALRHGEKHLPQDASILGTVCNNLGALLRGENRAEEALPLLEKALELGIKISGKDTPKVAIRHGNLGLALRKLGKFQESEQHFRSAIEIDRNHYGEKNDAVARDLNNLSHAIIDQGAERYEEALECLKQALEIGEACYQEHHYRLAIRHNNIAILLRKMKRFDLAEHHMHRAIDIDEKYYHPDHQEVAGDLFNLGLILADKGDLERAEQQFARSLHILRNTLGESHRLTAESREKLVEVRVKRGMTPISN